MFINKGRGLFSTNSSLIAYQYNLSQDKIIDKLCVMLNYYDRENS